MSPTDKTSVQVLLKHSAVCCVELDTNMTMMTLRRRRILEDHRVEQVFDTAVWGALFKSVLRSGRQTITEG